MQQQSNILGLEIFLRLVLKPAVWKLCRWNWVYRSARGLGCVCVCVGGGGGGGGGRETHPTLYNHCIVIA